MGLFIARLAVKADEPAMTELLTVTYRRSNDFQIRDEAYFSQHFAPNRRILLIGSGTRLLAMTAVDLLLAKSDFYDEDEGHFTPNLFPSQCLLRSATLHGWERQGFNSLLRLYALKAALEMQLLSSVSVVYKDAPRTRAMRQCGYKIFPLKVEGDDVFRNKVPCCFALLDLKAQGDFAVERLSRLVEPLMASTTWEGLTLEKTFENESHRA